MIEEITKISTYLGWFIIASAFISLIVSIFSFLFVISTRKRVKGTEEMVKQVTDAVNKLSTDAENASESAKQSAKGAERSARGAEEAAIAAKQSVIASKNFSEILMSQFGEQKLLLNQSTELSDLKKETNEREK